MAREALNCFGRLFQPFFKLIGLDPGRELIEFGNQLVEIGCQVEQDLAPGAFERGFEIVPLFKQHLRLLRLLLIDAGQLFACRHLGA